MIPYRLHRIFKKLKSEWQNTPLYQEVTLIVFVSTILLILSQRIDAFEMLISFVADYEEYELDEIISLILLLSFAFLAIAIRNVKYLQAEVKLRLSSEEKITQLVFFDPLTGLPNRTNFTEYLNKFVDQAEHSHQLGAVLFIDIDNFKEVNDNFGHAVGDELLCLFTQRVQNLLGEADTLARISGDEFNLLIDSPQDTDAISVLTEKLLNSLKTPFILNREEVFVGVSIGVAIYPTDAKTAGELVKCADIAMYDAKSQGKNTYRFYSQEIEMKAREKLKISNCLRKALVKQEFSIHYQPIIQLSSGKIIGSEALLRWNSDQLGIIPPDIFIPIAEQIGVINEIGDWVMLQACTQNKKWQQQHSSELIMAVNVSAKQLLSDDYSKKVQASLQASGLDAKYLEIELTETAIIQDLDLAARQIKALNALGVSIALDDFGTGYSSMSYLVKLQVDRLKIDKSFIDNVPQDTESVLMAQAIVSLAKNLNLSVTAEGIETQQQLDFIKATECDDVQGYFLSKPLNSILFELLLADDPFNNEKN